MEPIQATDRPAVPWRTATNVADLPVDPRLQGWLADSGSLTRRLRRLGGRDFHLSVLGEGWERSGEEDLRMLGSPAGRVRVRRVRLTARGVHLVFACTRMPPETLARHPWLGRLGHKPLGEALADRTDVRRTPLEFALLPAGDPLLEDALQGTGILPGKLWSRRSRFLIGESPILVYEVFLPGLASFGDP